MARNKKIRAAVEAALAAAGVGGSFLSQDGRQLPSTIQGACDSTLTIEAGAGDLKRFKMRAYSGGPLTLKEYDAPVVVDLAGCKIDAQDLPTPHNHDLTNVIGETDAVTITAEGIEATGWIDTKTDDGKLVSAASKGGLDWEVSIGAPVHAMEFYKRGESVTVNNRTFAGPVYIARKTTLKEISFVRRGADRGQTHVAIAATLKGTTTMDEFDLWLKASGFETPTALSDPQRTSLRTIWEKTKPGATPVPAIAATVPTIPAPALAAAVTSGNAAADLKASMKEMKKLWDIEARCKDHPEIKAQAITEDGLAPGWDIKRVENEIELKELRASRETGPYLITGSSPSSDPTATLQAIQGALLLRNGLKLDNPHYTAAQAFRLPSWLKAGLNTDQRQRAMEMSHRFQHINSIELCRLCCQLDKNTPPLDRVELIRAAFSGSSLTQVFTTSVNAIIVSSYLESPDTSAGWTQETDVNDFKSQDDIRLKTDGNYLKKLPRGTSAKHITREDEVESYKVQRYANQFVLDEQDMIDDRLGAFQEILPDMGKAAARLRPDLVYAILLANPTLLATATALFADANSPDNLRATNALTAANLKASISAMQLTQENGVNLNLAPTHLLVPPSLVWTAGELLQSAAIVIAGTAGSVTERGSKNTLLGAINAVVAEPRLENGVIDPATETLYSGSSTTWFLACALVRTIKVAFLTGSGRAPQVRNFTKTQGEWGMGWDIKHDIGAAAMDFRGLQKNTA